MTDDPGKTAGRPDGQKHRQQSGGGGDLATLGFQFAAVLLVFFFAGRWRDRRLDSDPWFMMIGLFLGAAGGIYSMYRKSMAMNDRDDPTKRGKR